MTYQTQWLFWDKLALLYTKRPYCHNSCVSVTLTSISAWFGYQVSHIVVLTLFFKNTLLLVKVVTERKLEHRNVSELRLLFAGVFWNTQWLEYMRICTSVIHGLIEYDLYLGNYNSTRLLVTYVCLSWAKDVQSMF